MWLNPVFFPLVTHTEQRPLCCGLCFKTHPLLSLLQHNVFWFQVSVDDPLAVEVG